MSKILKLTFECLIEFTSHEKFGSNFACLWRPTVIVCILHSQDSCNEWICFYNNWNQPRKLYLYPCVYQWNTTNWIALYQKRLKRDRLWFYSECCLITKWILFLMNVNSSFAAHTYLYRFISHWLGMQFFEWIDCILMTKLNTSFFIYVVSKNDIKAFNKLGIVLNLEPVNFKCRDISFKNSFISKTPLEMIMYLWEFILISRTRAHN